MQAANATAWLPGDPELDDEPLVPAEELLDEAAEEVLDPRWATVGVLEPPPHPAMSSMSAASPAVSCIAFIPSSPRACWISCARSFYGMPGYTTVSDAVTAL
jgi:hypothetical protein